MAEWCFAHPWMTFFLIAAALQTLSIIFGGRRND
jgi:hypothetical protein